jgi:ubiquinone biosynthesis protein UbiJ
MERPSFFSSGALRWRVPLPPAPPAWLQAELANRLVLLLNHVLQQEPEAMQRLRRHSGQRIHVALGALAAWLPLGPTVRWRVTPAGLLALDDRDDAPDLTLTLQEPGPKALVERALQGDKPAVAIAGDVQLAAEVAWLIDHVRWDLEDDLARLVGDAAAHTLVTWGRRVAQALRTQLLPRARALAERAAPRGGADPRATTTTPDGGAAA